MRYEVDATFGVLVSLEQRIKKGDKLGLTKDLQDVLVEKEGIIRDISFDGEKHVFVIEVEEDI